MRKKLGMSLMIHKQSQVSKCSAGRAAAISFILHVGKTWEKNMKDMLNSTSNVRTTTIRPKAENSKT